MKTVFITLEGAKHKIKTQIPDIFIDILNEPCGFIELKKRNRYCIINKQRIVEINEVPTKKSDNITT